MGIGTAQNGRVGHAWELDVIHVGAATYDEAWILAAFDTRTDQRRCHGVTSSFARQLAGGVLHSLHDVLIAGAATQIALKPPANLFLGGIGVALQQLMSRHDHAWGAEATLQAMFFPKPFLYGMQLILCTQPCVGQYLPAIGL